MNWLALLLVFAACSKPDAPARSWWCTDVACVASQDDCAHTVKALHISATCKSQATAVCSHGCVKHGENVLCAPTCYVDRDTCSVDVARAGTCREEPPPAHPELFPYYVEPGWWCGDIGAISSCEKVKDLCEATVHGTCSRPTGPVYCWGRRLTGAAAMATAAGGRVAYVCTKTMDACDQTLAWARVRGSGDFEIASPCAVWPYE